MTTAKNTPFAPAPGAEKAPKTPPKTAPKTPPKAHKVPRLSEHDPFPYRAAVDIHEGYEGAPTTLLQECNSIVQRRQPLSCGELCTNDGIHASDKDKFLKCRVKKRNNFECCDIELFTTGKTARVIVDDLFEKDEIDPSLLKDIITSFDFNQPIASNTID